VIAEVALDLGVQRPETARKLGLLLGGMALAELPVFKLPPRREKV
jgi:hypothetical protein